jgi:transposase
MSDRKKRRTWSASEKLRIVLAGLDGSIEISEPCRRDGINPTQYYGWKTHLLALLASCVAMAGQSNESV